MECTVTHLLKILQQLQASGHGNAKIYCNDAILHQDEVSVDSQLNVRLNGFLFNLPINEHIQEFKKDIQTAVDKFYTTTK